MHLDLEMENEILRLRVKELEKQIGSPAVVNDSLSREHLEKDEVLLPDSDYEKPKPRSGVIFSESSKIVLLDKSRKKSAPLPTGTLLQAAPITGHLRPEHNREFFMGLVEAPKKGRGRSAPGNADQDGGKDWIDPQGKLQRMWGNQ